MTLRPQFQGLSRSYMYRLVNSYSLDRLGRLLAAGGVSEWHARLHSRPAPRNGQRSYDVVTIILRKG